MNERGAADYEASISIEAGEPLAKVLTGSLSPEAERPSSTRSRVSLEASGGRLDLMISASDVTALRATVNSYLRWVDAILDLLDRVGEAVPRP